MSPYSLTNCKLAQIFALNSDHFALGLEKLTILLTLNKAGISEDISLPLNKIQSNLEIFYI